MPKKWIMDDVPCYLNRFNAAKVLSNKPFCQTSAVLDCSKWVNILQSFSLSQRNEDPLVTYPIVFQVVANRKEICQNPK